MSIRTLSLFLLFTILGSYCPAAQSNLASLKLGDVLLSREEYSSLDDTDKFIYLLSAQVLITDINPYSKKYAHNFAPVKSSFVMAPLLWRLTHTEARAALPALLLRIALTGAAREKILKATVQLLKHVRSGLATYGAFEAFNHLTGTKNQEPTPEAKTDTSSMIPPSFDTDLEIEHFENGSPCLYGLHPSVYKKTKTESGCQRPKSSIDPVCKKNQFMCLFSKIKIDGVKLDKESCVTHTPKETLSARCLEKLLAHIENHLTKKNPRSGASLTMLPEELLTTIDKIKDMESSLKVNPYFDDHGKNQQATIQSYCKTKAVSSDTIQSRECTAFNTYLKVLADTKATDIIFSNRSPTEEKNSKPENILKKANK